MIDQRSFRWKGLKRKIFSKNKTTTLALVLVDWLTFDDYAYLAQPKIPWEPKRLSVDE